MRTVPANLVTTRSSRNWARIVDERTFEKSPRLFIIRTEVILAQPAMRSTITLGL